MSQNRISYAAAALIVGVAAVGCSGKQAPMQESTLESQVRQQEKEIASLKSSLERQTKEVDQLESELQTKSNELTEAQRLARDAEARMAAERKQMAADSGSGSSSSSRGSVTNASGSLLPPARPGECYARVFVPPTYATDSEEVLKREASHRIEIVPARFEWAQERVMTKEASHRLEAVPAVYETVKEKVLVKEASHKIETVPAVYETKEEKILVKEAHTVWKKGRGPVEKVDSATGEIMCLVEVPAQYRTVTRRVLKSPATTKKVEIPAEYKTVTRRVLKTPATTRKVEIPAEYSTVKVRKMVEPARERRVDIPAEYQTVTRTKMVSEGGLEWRPVLCETNMSTDVVADVQRALQSNGHNPGPIDGILGPQTMAGVRSFQKDTGLARGGLTMETLNALKVDPGSAVARK